jgi:dGTPase
MFLRGSPKANAAPQQRSLAAEIMDWADDITFAIHDLLDFYCAGKILIDRCKQPGSAEFNRMLEGMFRRKPEWTKDRADYTGALEAIVREFPIEAHQQYSDSPEDRAKLFAFSTGLIGYFVDAITVRSREKTRGPLAEVDPEVRCIVEVLKQFIWEYVIQSPDLAVPQQGQRLAIRTVFGQLTKAAEGKNWYVFPPGYRDAISEAKKKAERARVVADCISGMTEKELLHLYRRGEGIA